MWMRPGVIFTCLGSLQGVCHLRQEMEKVAWDSKDWESLESLFLFIWHLEVTWKGRKICKFAIWCSLYSCSTREKHLWMRLEKILFEYIQILAWGGGQVFVIHRNVWNWNVSLSDIASECKDILRDFFFLTWMKLLN